MQRAICESCGAVQPPEWKPGDLCGHCGAQVRHETRCPWCTRWSPGKFCRACGCELVEPELFGVARMLKDAGIDRLALVSRLRALDDGQRATFASQYASQRAIVARRVDEMRLVESFLLQRGFAAALEDELVPSLPFSPEGLAALSQGPQGAFEGRTDLLPEIEAKSPIGATRSLAGLALLRRAEITRERVDDARSMAWMEGPAGLEAALALSHWRLHRAGFREPGVAHDDFTLAWRALDGIVDPVTRPYAALANAWPIESVARRGHETAARWLAALEPILRDALATSKDEDLRFGCAVVLRDEAALAAWMDDADERRREIAQAAAATKGGNLALRRLTAGNDEERARILRSLPHEYDLDALDAALQAWTVAGDAVRAQILEFVRGRRFRDLPAPARDALGRFVLDNAATLGDESVFAMLAWATRSYAWEDPLPAEEAVQPLLDAVTARLAAADGAELAAIADKRGDGLRAWLAYARASDASQRDRLFRGEASATAAWTVLRVLERELERAVEGGERSAEARKILPLTLFVESWDRATPPERLAWVKALRAGRDAYPLVSHDRFFAAMWERFLAQEDDRFAIRLLLECAHLSWEIGDAIEKNLPDWPQGGRDPVATLRALVELTPDNVYDALDRVLKGLPPAQFPAVRQTALEMATLLVGRSMRALPPIGRLVRAFEVKLRDADPLSPDSAVWRADLPAFAKQARALMAASLAAPGDEERDWGTRKVQELEEEISALETRVLAAEAEAARKAKEQEEAEARARAAEEEKRKAAEEAARRAEEEKKRAAARTADEEKAARLAAFDELEAKRRGVATPPRTPASMPADGGVPTANGGTSIDDEPFFADSPLPTIRAYAGFLRKIQGGADPMALMKEHGLDPMSWSQVVTAWSQLFMKRPELALRFAQLLQSA